MIVQEIQRLTAREIFDLTKKHLEEQQEQSWHRGVCGYRGTSTVPQKPIACAVGWRIPDALYTTELENKKVADLINNYSFEWLLPSDLDAEQGLNFLELLQGIHDYYGPEHWEEELAAVEVEWFPKKS